MVRHIVILLLCTSLLGSEIEMARNGVIRDQPTSKGHKLSNADKGARFTLVSDALTNNWYHINWQNADAWIWSGHVAKPAEPETQTSTIRIGSFNCLHLGWGSTKDFNLLAQIIAKTDVCALIEVMADPHETELLAALKATTKANTGKDVEWKMIQSALVGRTSYRERYGFVYRTDRVQVLDIGRFIDDEGDVFERDPYYATFKSGNFDFTLMAVHITFGGSKSDRRPEIEHLRAAYEQVRGNSAERDILLVGDFNMPPNDSSWKVLTDPAPIAPMTVTFNIENVITKDMKTSLGKKGLSESYDNIWFDRTFTINEYAGNAEAFNFVDAFFDGTDDRYELAKTMVSDHLPVWAEFKTDGADDD